MSPMFCSTKLMFFTVYMNMDVTMWTTDGDWRLWVTTGTDAAMATTNSVEMYVYGTKGMLGPIALGHEDEEPHFGAGATDEFKVCWSMSEQFLQ